MPKRPHAKREDVSVTKDGKVMRLHPYFETSEGLENLDNIGVKQLIGLKIPRTVHVKEMDISKEVQKCGIRVVPATCIVLMSPAPRTNSVSITSTKELHELLHELNIDKLLSEFSLKTSKGIIIQIKSWKEGGAIITEFAGKPISDYKTGDLINIIQSDFILSSLLEGIYSAEIVSKNHAKLGEKIVDYRAWKPN